MAEQDGTAEDAAGLIKRDGRAWRMEGGGRDTVEVGGYSYNRVKVAATSQAAPSSHYL